MESNSASPAGRLHPKTSLKTLKSPPIPIFLLLLCGFFLLHIPTTSALVDPISQFAEHCHPFLPSNYTDLHSFPLLDSPAFQIGFFSGGGSLFPQSDYASEFPKSAIFVPYFTNIVNNSSQRGIVVNIRARLSLKIPRSLSAAYQRAGYPINGRGLRFRVRAPRIPVLGVRGRRSVDLIGFWSEPTGRLCMVGSGRSIGNVGKFNLNNVVLKLNYSKNSTIFGSLVSGVLENLNPRDDSSYFEPVSILAVREFHDYNLTLVDSGDGNSGLIKDDDDERESLSLNEVPGGICGLTSRRTLRFELEYSSDCANGSCSPIRGDVGYVPSFMFFKQIRCVEKGKMVVLLAFRNSSTLGRSTFPFDPNTTWIAEGEWGEKENRFHGVACRILNFTHSLTDASVGDCSSKFSMRFLKTMSLRKRGSLVGQIWSSKAENDTGNFGRIWFSSVRQLSLGLPGLKYEYFEIEGARKSCASKNTAKLKRKKYPDGYSSDMRFDVSLRNSKGQIAQGYASPIFVGDQLYRFQNGLWRGLRPQFQQSVKSDSPLNISYYITFASDFEFGGGIPVSKDVEISAEGLYDGDTGRLCMIGCRRLISAGEKLIKNHSLDCNITITLQFSPLHSAGIDHVKGTMESTRPKSDPLYFKRIDLSSKSLYSEQAKESIWRMDLEVTMVLISYTLACLFVGLQLFHVKKHPDVLPSISIVMLIVLTLGYMIPLLLNFEALFLKNRNQQNAFLQSGGWLEVNEIIVRMVTMVAFLLQFRLLQLTWTARQSGESENSLWGAEKKVLYASLPFYISGGLIAWLIHLWKSSTHSPFLRRNMKYMVPAFPVRAVYQQPSLWSALRSYGGLILDGFLLPQIAFNIFSNSSKVALTAPYYIGATLVRSLPHAYDLYRAHSESGSLDFSYIYANHKMDFYSTAWNIIIPASGLLFAVLLFLQQRFGGRCFLPRRFRDSNAYEKVASVEMQGESVQ